MKAKITLLVLFVYCSIALFGQTITPNKVWHIESGYPCPNGDGTGCFCLYGLQTIKVGNTKTFNEKEYYELLSDNVNQQWQVITYVREEEKKVFFYDIDDDEEYLMYDYDLNIGDEIVLRLPQYPHSIITDAFKVITIDSIEYNGIKRKRLCLENLITIHRYDYWVEEIGCMRGITYLASAYISGGVSQLKDCYESNELIFVNENPEFCFAKIPDAINEVLQDSIHVFPDENNVLHILNAKDIPLIIYDIQGREIQSVFPDNNNYGTDISFLSKGLYIVSNKIQSINFKIAVK